MSGTMSLQELEPMLRLFGPGCTAPMVQRGLEIPPPENAPEVGMTLCAPAPVPTRPAWGEERLGRSATEAERSRRAVALAVEDLRYHVLYESPTGSGKTVSIAAGVEDLVHARDRKGRRPGIVLVDPKDGQLARYVLQRIPREDWDRVHLIDPTRHDRSVGINVLEAEPAKRHSVSAQLADLIGHLFGSQFSARQRYVLDSTAKILMRHGGMTLCDLPVLLQEPEAQAYFRRGVDDPLGEGRFWSWFDGLGEKGWKDTVEPLIYKLLQVLGQPAMRHLFGQVESTLSFREALDAGGIVIISLPQEAMGEDATSLAGSMLLHRLWQEIQRRQDTPEHDRAPAVAVVDEFPMVLRMGGSVVADMVTQARGYNLGLLLACQMGSQLSGAQEAIEANVGTEVCWQLRTNAHASKVAGRYPVEPEQLLRLGTRQVMVRMAINGSTTGPFTGYAVPPSDWDPDSAHLSWALEEHAKQFAAYVLEHRARPRSEIDAELLERYQRVRGPQSGGDDFGGWERT